MTQWLKRRPIKVWIPNMYIGPKEDIKQKAIEGENPMSVSGFHASTHARLHAPTHMHLHSEPANLTHMHIQHGGGGQDTVIRLK